MGVGVELGAAERLPPTLEAVANALQLTQGVKEEEKDAMAPVVKVDVNKGVVVGVALEEREERGEDVVDPDRVCSADKEGEGVSEGDVVKVGMDCWVMQGETHPVVEGVPLALPPPSRGVTVPPPPPPPPPLGVTVEERVRVLEGSGVAVGVKAALTLPTTVGEKLVEEVTVLVIAAVGGGEEEMVGDTAGVRLRVGVGESEEMLTVEEGVREGLIGVGVRRVEGEGVEEADTERLDLLWGEGVAEVHPVALEEGVISEDPV